MKIQRSETEHNTNTDQNGDSEAEVVDREVRKAEGLGLRAEQRVCEGEAAGSDIAVYTRVAIQQLL